ncbi:MAG TPA: thiamine-phosphate kinase [Verrucomicrobiae bacterium]|nr:thiamine-phosphate kinase [Verrucomicrobiae bacterium]
MKEFELISRLTRSLHTNPSVVVGAGDDCAVIDLGIPDRLLLFKTDAVVQGVHFDSAAPPEKVGHKAIARCLSDIAAMAGTPTAALITLALPDPFDPEYVDRIYRGLNATASKYDVAIAGGETTTNPERLLISISLLGWASRGKAISRSGAQAGDALFVSGHLGGSIGAKHLEFEPRLEEARWLADHFKIHAMIDLSDGLAGDLKHLLRQGLGAELLASAIPISREARRAAKVSNTAKTGLIAALTDGEDFELLFALAGRDAVSLLDSWKARFPKIPLHCIGKITSSPGIQIRDRHGLRPLNLHGYEHFA